MTTTFVVVEADLGGHAEILVGRIADRLIAHFGDSNIFLDIQKIPPGREFDEFIGEQVAQADALLAIIGPDWLPELQARAGQRDDEECNVCSGSSSSPIQWIFPSDCVSNSKRAKGGDRFERGDWTLEI